MSDHFITIKDIAQACEVSVGTVSRALNNHNNIKPETKEKIIKMAYEMGYVKNQLAASLRSKSRKIIGLVITGSANPFYAEVIEGIEDEARLNGYHMIFTDTMGNHRIEEQAVQNLIKTRVDGLIIGPDYEAYDYFSNLNERHIPFVIIGRNFSNMDLNEVRTEEKKGAYIAVNALIKHGHKKIAMITSPKFMFRENTRLEGYQKALNENNITYDESLVYITNDISFEEGDKATRKLLKSGKVFTALFCYNDLIAFGAMKALQDMNIKVPEDISIIGFDNVKYASKVFPPLTTVGINKYSMGKTAVKLLLNIIKNGDDIKTKKIFPPKLIERDSIRSIL